MYNSFKSVKIIKIFKMIINTIFKRVNSICVNYMIWEIVPDISNSLSKKLLVTGTVSSFLKNFKFM